MSLVLNINDHYDDDDDDDDDDDEDDDYVYYNDDYDDGDVTYIRLRFGALLKARAGISSILFLSSRL